jgi:heme/copper-type cytochrome/quinol oxidase subunit 2
MWYAVLGAPLAWWVQLLVGYWVNQTNCSVPGQRWGINDDTWGIVLMVACFAVAAGSGLISLAMFRGTADAEKDDAPPPGRAHFLAIVGMTVTVLFLFIIVMTGLGVVILPDCHQS